MNLIIIIMILAIILLIISRVYDINIRKLKHIAEYEEEKFNEIVEKYPSNIEICKNILKKVKNEKVKVEEDKESKTSLYIAISDKIIIADVKNSYTRIQTIAHECLHSIQDRRIQIFNFICPGNGQACSHGYRRCMGKRYRSYIRCEWKCGYTI